MSTRSSSWSPIDEARSTSTLNAPNDAFATRERKEVVKVVWRILNRARQQHGQGMVEYALILVLVSIVVIVILLTMGNQIVNVFSNVVAALG